MADNYEDLSWSGMLIVVIVIGTIIITCIFNFQHKLFFILSSHVFFTTL